MCVRLHINEVLSFSFSKGYFVYFNITQLTLSSVWHSVQPGLDWLLIAVEHCMGTSTHCLPHCRAESAEMVKPSCYSWKLWNYTKSEILKQYQDSASRLTPKIDFHFQLWGYFCCLRFYFQPQHSAIYHKTHFYKSSPSQQTLFL